ncbi:MAG: hypothetical protein ABI831_11155 [Betaproteobacteria bacterium]
MAWRRLPLLVLGFCALFAGIGAGLARLGFAVPAVAASAAALHGPLMLCGFFGVVISLERAVALGRNWAYLAPLLTGLGTVAALGGGAAYAPWLMLAGSVVFLAASVAVLRRQTALFTLVLVLGAGAWVVGNVLWLSGLPLQRSVPWWLAFLILTIAGERLELSRFMAPSLSARNVFVAILLAIIVGLGAAPRPWADLVFAGALLALSLWLVKQDIARRTVRGKALTRFVAVSLLAGYAWLAIGAGIMLAAGGLHAGTPAYGAAVHALALGFVFSMVFGHAPIIFPAVLRVAVPWHPLFYVPLALLHGSLIVRLAGDALGRFEWLRQGGLFNAVALVAFVVGIASAVLRGSRMRHAASGAAPDGGVVPPAAPGL